jgi:hypothetical protein
MHKYGPLAVILVSVAAFSGTACTKTSSCSRDDDSLIVGMPREADGSIADAGAGGVGLDVGPTIHGNTYISAPVGGPYAYFPPARTISFEHGLGTTPYSIQFWLAFTPLGSLAPSAGNMTELRNLGPDDPEPALNDRRISVRNNTCSDFYLWVVATRPSP